MKRWGWMVICLSWGIFGEAQAQQALEDRVADLEKKLLESQKNTQILSEELDAVKKQAQQIM